MASDRVNAALEELKAAAVEDGIDEATVNAQLNGLFPGDPIIGGNYADLQRMGSIATTGTMAVSGAAANDEGDQEVEASNTDDAFVMPADSPTADAVGSGSVPPGQEGDTGTAGTADTGTADDAAPAEDDAAPAEGDDGGDIDSMTKAELQEEADRRGVQVSSSMTKQEMIDAINGGG